MQTISKLFLEEYDSELMNDTNQDANRLEELVRSLSFERHIYNNPSELLIARKIIESSLQKHCDFVEVQGRHKNVVAGWGSPDLTNKHIIGAHYDGPPGSPGADDNASAIAVLCLLAEKLSNHAPEDVLLVAFNGEEEGLLGSREFVKETKPQSGVILEMVGYFTKEENTQQMPQGLPEFSVGDFLAIVGNRSSGDLGKNLLKLARESDLKLPLKNLKIPFGLENKLPGLDNTKRSDHYPFWKNKIPAVMLTDTAEFRNKNYHMLTDTPEKLNYNAMSQVVELLTQYAKSV